MTLATATPPVVRALVRKLRQEPAHGRVMGVHAQPVWSHEPEFTIDGSTVRVRACLSPLAVREALVEQQDNGAGYLVIVTDCTDVDLGAGIRARLARRQLIPVDLWATVKESFRASHIDGAFVRRDKAWAPRALVDHEPPAGWPEAPGGSLTRDVALGQLAGLVLGVDADHIDAIALLAWSRDPIAVRRWLDLAADVRTGLGAWLGERTGSAGVLTLRAVEAGHGPDVLPLALVADLLWDPGANPADVGMAQGLLAARLGGQPPDTAQVRAWGKTAKVLVAGELADAAADGAAAVERAELLVDELGARAVASLSRFLPCALDYRLHALAAALGSVLPTPEAADLPEVEQALAAAADHELAATDARVPTAVMAVRLVRWLVASADPADPPGHGADGATTLAEALDRQARRDAWVDRAYAAVHTGGSHPRLAAAYHALAEAIAARRSAHDEELARLLADATTSDADLGRIVPVEQALTRLVAPLCTGDRGVLLLVIDGMSTAVLTEIAEGMAARRWTELVDADLGARQALLPALPTLTEVSRTSLLTGALRVGGAAQEKKHFAAALGCSAAIFHKDDLRAPAGAALAPEVASAIADPGVRVVGVVLNTVDDTLHKLDPGGTAWSIDTVQHLPALLDAARGADRVVILTSDHGHVVERGSTLVPYAEHSAPRWRPAGSGPPGDGEVLVSGPRVLLGGQAVVLPWREDLRYAAKCAGYHGGASAAEVAVPFTVHVRGPVTLASWVPAPPPEPPWWHSPLATPPPGVSPPAPSTRQPARPAASATREAPAPVAAETALVDALLGSAVYAAQRLRAGRAAPDDVRVRALVGALIAHGGRLHEQTLASVAAIPAARLRTVLAAVRKLLNVEGYDVVGIDADRVTVVLDEALLREQFRLGT